MSNKKTIIFLCISLTFVAITLISFIVSASMSYYNIKADFPNDSVMASGEFIFGLFVALCIFFPVLGNELSCIRSIYKMLKYDPYGFVKIIYTISSTLAFAAFAFYCISALGWIDYVDTNGLDHSAIVLLLTEWPIFIASFILGCIPIKSKTATSTKRVKNI